MSRNGHLLHRPRPLRYSQAVLILYGISAAFGIFAVILFESGIWKALSFMLMIIVAIALGYKNFESKKSEDSKYVCTECKYIYNPKYGNEKAGIKPGTKFDELPKDIDVLYHTRIQSERFEGDFGKEEYIINKEVLNKFSDKVMVLHPLPRNNEISEDIDDDPRAMYFEQAENGMYVRMAILKTILGK